jgi:hypothetical protein
MMMLRLLLLASSYVITRAFIALETYLANRVNDSILCLYTFNGTPLVSAIPGCPFGPLIANESNTNTSSISSFGGVQLFNTSTPVEPHLVSSDVAVTHAFYTSVINHGVTFELIFRAYKSHVIASSNVNLFAIAGAYDDHCMHRGFRLELSDRRLLVLIFYTIEPDGSCLEQHFYSMMETQSQPCLVPMGSPAQPPPMTHAFVSIRPQALENTWLVFFLLSYINDEGAVQTCVAYNAMGGRGPPPHDANMTNSDDENNIDDKREHYEKSFTRRSKWRHLGGMRLYLGNNARTAGYRRQIPPARRHPAHETPDTVKEDANSPTILTLLDEVQEKLELAMPPTNGFFVALNGKKIFDVNTVGISFRNRTKLGQAQVRQTIQDALASVAASHAVRTRQEQILRARSTHVNSTSSMTRVKQFYPLPNASATLDMYWFVIANATWNVRELRTRNDMSVPVSLGVRNRSVYLDDEDDHTENDDGSLNTKFIDIHLGDIVRPLMTTHSPHDRNQHDLHHPHHHSPSSWQSSSSIRHHEFTPAAVQIHYLYPKDVFRSSISSSSTEKTNGTNRIHGMWKNCHHTHLNTSSSSSTLTVGSIVLDQCARFQLELLSPPFTHTHVRRRQPVAIIGYAAASGVSPATTTATAAAVAYVHVFLKDRPPRRRQDTSRIDIDHHQVDVTTILLAPPYAWTRRVKKHALAMFSIPLWIVPSRFRAENTNDDYDRHGLNVVDANLTRMIFRVTLEGPGSGGRLNTTSDFLAFRSLNMMKTHYCGFDRTMDNGRVCLAKDNHSTGVVFELLGPVQNPTRLVFRGSLAQIQRALTNISWVNWRHGAHNASLDVRVEHILSSSNSTVSSDDRATVINVHARRQFTMHFLPPTELAVGEAHDDEDETTCTPAALTFGLLCRESFGSASVYSLWISIVFVWLMHHWTRHKCRHARSMHTRVQNEDEFNGMLDQFVYIVQEPTMEAATALWCACRRRGRPQEVRLCAETLLCLLFPTFPRFLASLMIHHPHSCRASRHCRHTKSVTSQHCHHDDSTVAGFPWTYFFTRERRHVTTDEHDDHDEHHDNDDDPHALLIRLYFKCVGRAWFADLIQAWTAAMATNATDHSHVLPLENNAHFVLTFFDTVWQRLPLLPAPLTITLQVGATSGYRSRSQISILWTHFLAPACAAVFTRDMCLALEHHVHQHAVLPRHLDWTTKTRYTIYRAHAYFNMDRDDSQGEDNDEEKEKGVSFFNIGYDPSTEYRLNANLVQSIMPTVMRHLYCLFAHHRQVIVKELTRYEDPTVDNDERPLPCVGIRLDQVLEALEGTRHVTLNEVLALYMDPVHALQY